MHVSNRTFIIILTTTIVNILLFYFGLPRKLVNMFPANHTGTTRNSETTPQLTSTTEIYLKCPDVLKYMTSGKWKPRQMSRDEEAAYDVFLSKARAQNGIPASLERPDKLCGNTTFDDPELRWFRPLCDPRGLTPCCFNNKCVNRSVSECVCKNCMDMRATIHAEYASWIPTDKQCQVPHRPRQELCHFVDKLNIIFIGDSFIRHIYLSFILLLNDNLFDGAMKASVPKSLHDQCTGFYMFTEKQCRPLILSDPMLCNSRVRLKFYEYQSAVRFGSRIIQLVNAYSRDPNSFFILGTGIHDEFNAFNVLIGYLYPILSQWKMLSINPNRLLWHAAHAPGLLKTSVGNQGYEFALRFNKEMKGLLTKYNIPIFESFNMTDGVTSFDGPHYGQGVNIMKARIIFEYIRELRENSRL